MTIVKADTVLAYLKTYPCDEEGWISITLRHLVDPLGASIGTLSYLVRQLLATGALEERRLIGRQRLLRVADHVQNSKFWSVQFAESKEAGPQPQASAGPAPNVQDEHVLAVIAKLWPEIDKAIAAGTPAIEAVRRLFEPFRRHGFAPGIWDKRVAELGEPMCLLGAAVTLATPNVRNPTGYLSTMLCATEAAKTIPKQAFVRLRKGQQVRLEPEPSSPPCGFASAPEPELRPDESAESAASSTPDAEPLMPEPPLSPDTEPPPTESGGDGLGEPPDVIRQAGSIYLSNWLHARDLVRQGQSRGRDVMDHWEREASKRLAKGG